MFIIGGLDASPRKDCLQPRLWFFDLVTLRYSLDYIRNDTPYQVPEAIFEWIGGK